MFTNDLKIISQKSTQRILIFAHIFKEAQTSFFKFIVGVIELIIEYFFVKKFPYL